MKALGKATLTLGLMLIVSLLMTSCSGVVTPELDPEEINKVEEIDYVYLEVPYEKYAGANWCLPASGAMTFKYFGMNISQSRIASKVITDGSSSVFRFISFAKSLGFDSKYQSITIEEIKVLLEEDIPVIAVQNYSLSLPFSHARVIIGFDDEKQEVITNDPTAGKDYKISYANFSALNSNSNSDKTKVIVLSPEVDTLNAELIDDTDNS
jgi:ABC-type bacteriocin/lantibiotic exporter with double-glycine peptidase domain